MINKYRFLMLGGIFKDLALSYILTDIPNFYSQVQKSILALQINFFELYAFIPNEITLGVTDMNESLFHSH